VSRAPLLAVLALVAACDGGCPPIGGDAGPDGGGGFDDHTVPRIDDVAQFHALAGEGVGSSALKVIVTSFDSPAQRRLLYMDAAFYTLHDEWYWFRLMNGQPVAGVDEAPYAGAFATVQDVHAWAQAQDPDALPLDLAWVGGVGGRLYSPRFYELALNVDPRVLGLATVVYFPPRTEPAQSAREEIWAFELEFQDDLSHEDLIVFFELLDDTLPDGVSGAHKWLVRSPPQEALAQRMEDEGLRYADRVLRFDEVVVPGEIEVYSEGLTAGRVVRVETPDGTLAQSRSTDLLALGFVPDFLPPATGLITAIPQTPLAHVNVLARNRGIPNVYVGGLMADANVDQLARVRAPALLLAEADPPRVVLQAISEQEFATWRQLTAQPAIALPPIEMDTLPYTLDLASESLADVDALRPVVGGKAAGFLALLAPGDVVVPDAPLAVTVRAFAEHMTPDEALLGEALADADFRRDARLRYLVLEGEQAYRARYGSAADEVVIDDALARDDADAVKALILDGGVKRRILERPVNPGTLSTIRDALVTQFADFASTQGLRFRSSSNVEDIEGFNGAGLYASHTGFLYPELAGDGRDVEAALRRTWASYWGSEAFEERALARVDHLSGHMGVLVHARFDDPFEVSNAVFTYTLLPDDFDDEGELVVNVQVGALSVTNPPPGTATLPEIDVVRLAAGEGALRVERVQGSTELPAGDVVLTDVELEEIFFAARAVTQAWLEQDNAALFVSQRRRTLTLDFELREMAAGWPARVSGVSPHRLVLKQARSLEPSLSSVPADVVGLPYPRDVLARARRVERRFCQADAFTLTISEAYTDPLKAPDLGHDVDPFTAFVTIDVTADLPALGFDAGRRMSFIHTSFLRATHPGTDDGGWTIEVDIDPARSEATNLTSIAFAPEGSYRLARGDAEVTGDAGACEVTLQLSSSEDFLRSLIDD
jgi:hypothetical protein